MNPKPQDSPTLDAAFAALRAEYNEQPPPYLELALRSRLRSRRRLKRVWISSVIAAAALLFLALFSVVQRRTPEHAVAPLPIAVQHKIPAANPNLTSASPAPQQIAVASHRPPRAHRARPAPHPVAAGARNFNDSPFLPIPYAEPLAPSEQIDIYRVQLPRVALAHYGVPARLDSANSPVTADVAVGSDGIVRAIRFVPNSQSQ